ncbi:winged helix-turn-helix domain-containing protein [Streptomyces sp. URMC 127]|uniref:winged helix-turn-helix domain-containing protein n=1 Tax=Streptomyces sp. URMC 127 TaxID=3423402 RepID=UPI003F1D6D85
MLRIHFGPDDLGRVRLTPGPDPLAEAALSLPVLQNRWMGGIALDGWRQRTQRGLSPLMRPLLELAPADMGEYLPEAFLHAEDGATTLTESLESVWALPQKVWTAELECALDHRPVPQWFGDLHTADRPAARTVDQAFRSYYDTALAPYWSQVTACVQADRTRRMRIAAEQGVEHLLATLHPTVRWESPVLHVPCRHNEGFHRDFHDVHLAGRGLTLTPSFFWPHPTARAHSADDEAPIDLCYPVALDLSAYQAVLAAPAGPAGRGAGDLARLTALLGRTRARVLDAAADGGSTAQLARRAGISPASASEHATVLREAGLLTTRRTGPSVLHTLTPLGQALLDGVV